MSDVRGEKAFKVRQQGVEQMPPALFHARSKLFPARAQLIWPMFAQCIHQVVVVLQDPAFKAGLGHLHVELEADGVASNFEHLFRTVQ